MQALTKLREKKSLVSSLVYAFFLPDMPISSENSGKQLHS